MNTILLSKENSLTKSTERIVKPEIKDEENDNDWEEGDENYSDSEEDSEEIKEDSDD